MADFKELLGEAYTPELEAKLNAEYLPKANVDGEVTRHKKEAADAKRALSELKTAQMSSEEKAQSELKLVLEAAAAETAAAKRERSVIALQKGLAKTGMDLSAYDDLIEEIAGSDPENAEKMSKKFAKLLADTHAAGVKAANEQHIKNAKAPEGGTKTPQSDIEAMEAQKAEFLKANNMTAYIAAEMKLSELRNK